MAQDLSDPRCRELILAEALSHVPGIGPAIKPVPIPHPVGSQFNQSFMVSTAAGCFVVRLSPGADAWLATDRSVERQLHAVAAAAAIAPEVIHADLQDRWLITRFVEGTLWTPAQFADPTALMHLGGTLRRLHALAPPAAGHCNLLQALARYVRRLEGAGAVAAGGLRTQLTQAASRWELSGASGRPPSILHHDLNASNIIDGPAGLVLLDWECAAVGDPLLDVACVLSYYDASRPHASVLLRSCGLERVSAAQLEAAVWLFDLHTWLWYRERRLRLAPTLAELAAEQRLWQRLTPG